MRRPPSRDIPRLYTPTPAEKIPEPAPPEPSRTAVILWLIVLALLILFLPVYLFSAFIGSQTQNAANDLSAVRTSLTNVPTPLLEVQRQLTPLAQLQTQINQVSAILPTLISPSANWSAVMNAIAQYDPKKILITSMSLNGGQLTLNGRAAVSDDIANYAAALERSGLFTRVIVQSIQADSTVTATLLPTLTGIPTATPLPTLATTATPNLTTTPRATDTPTPRRRPRQHSRQPVRRHPR